MPTDDVASVLDFLALPIPDFVDTAYHLLLGRAPSLVEAKEQCGALRAGLGRLRLLSDLSESAEFRHFRDSDLRDQSDGAFVEQLYQRYLGRQIDPQGMDLYLSLLARGKSRQRIARRIAVSPEARAKRTLWFELEQILTDEWAERHWFFRWTRKARRRERRRNQMIEVTMRLGSMHGPTTDTTRMATPSQLDPYADAFSALGPDARRFLSRARLATISSVTLTRTAAT